MEPGSPFGTNSSMGDYLLLTCSKFLRAHSSISSRNTIEPRFIPVRRLNGNGSSRLRESPQMRLTFDPQKRGSLVGRVDVLDGHRLLSFHFHLFRHGSSVLSCLRAGTAGPGLPYLTPWTAFLSSCSYPSGVMRTSLPRWTASNLPLANHLVHCRFADFELCGHLFHAH